MGAAATATAAPIIDPQLRGVPAHQTERLGFPHWLADGAVEVEMMRDVSRHTHPFVVETCLTTVALC
ncbi:hypothetical protein GCM10027200_52090 [Lentzea nigeriaca]